MNYVKLSALVLAIVTIVPLTLAAQSLSGMGDPVGTQAAIVDFHEMKTADGKTVIHRSIKVPDPDLPGKTLVIGQVLEPTPDGGLLIIPGKQPVEADVYRQRLCQKLGGIDTTNESRVIIQGTALDATSCKQPSSQAAKDLPKSGLLIN